MNTRSLVIDIDDTISTHVNRDYINAKPHLDIIQKINEFYDLGWEIILFTARGMVSCNGDLNLIEETKREDLENWLKKWNVKYSKLQFGKPLGVYYVDDKSLRPNEFLDLKYKILSGRSGDKIEQIGNRVIKTGKASKMQYDWYLYVKENNINIKIPNVNTFYNNELDIEYIEGTNFNTIYNKTYNKDIINILNIFKDHKKIEFYNWKTMVDRIKDDHLRFNSIPHEKEILNIIDNDRTHNFFNSNFSLMHGDLTLGNMIYDNINNELYLLDPNLPKGIYSSWILDAGKILQSLHFFYEESFTSISNNELQIKEEGYKHFIKQYPNEEKYILLSELIHYIRMIKYKQDFEKIKVYNIIKNLYNIIIQYKW